MFAPPPLTSGDVNYRQPPNYVKTPIANCEPRQCAAWSVRWAGISVRDLEAVRLIQIVRLQTIGWHRRHTDQRGGHGQESTIYRVLSFSYNPRPAQLL